MLETVAYAGTGDVLKVQRLLALCGEHTEVDEASAWKVPTLPPNPSPPHSPSRGQTCPKCAALQHAEEVDEASAWKIALPSPPSHPTLPRA